MLVGEIRNQIDSIWDDFWSVVVANPLAVMEQLTYLLFIKRLDELQSAAETKASTLGKPLDHRVFPEGVDPRGEPQASAWDEASHRGARTGKVSAPKPRRTSPRSPWKTTQTATNYISISMR